MLRVRKDKYTAAVRTPVVVGIVVCSLWTVVSGIVGVALLRCSQSKLISRAGGVAGVGQTCELTPDEVTV